MKIAHFQSGALQPDLAVPGPLGEQREHNNSSQLVYEVCPKLSSVRAFSVSAINSAELN